MHAMHARSDLSKVILTRILRNIMPLLEVARRNDADTRAVMEI